MSYTDTALNLAWAFLCIGALACHWIRERRHNHSRTQSVRAHRMLSVFLAAVSLFPCISASDDGIRLRDLAAGIPHQAAFTQSRTGNLPLLLEDLDHAQTATPFVLALVLCFLLMVRLEQFVAHRSFHADSQSRAPPAF